MLQIYFVFGVFFTSITTNGISAACVCGVQASSGRIIGGQEAAADIYPWIAALIYSFGHHLCGGALISDRYVVTAAHCVVKRTARNSKIVVGFHNLNQTTAEDRLKIEEIIIHPKYDDQDLTGHHDIALIKLSEKVVFSQSVTPICLPAADDLTFKNLVVAGWGKTSNSDGIKPHKLQHVAVPQVDTKVCADRWPKYKQISEGQICAGTLGKDSCGGDSGGPLMATVGGRTYLAGVVSYGYERCGSSFPAVYTRVSAYLPWIVSYVGAACQ